jgi:hypothetical protein
MFFIKIKKYLNSKSFIYKYFSKINFYIEVYFKIKIKKKILPRINNLNFKIPLIVYQMWINNYLTRTHAKEINRFRNLNPDVEFNLFSHEDVDKYMSDFYKNYPIYKIYQKAKYHQIKADIFRYCILYERGGMWFDIKSGLKISITKLFDCNSDAIISYEKNDINWKQSDNLNSAKVFQHPNKKILMWGIAFCKSSIILKKIIEQICDNYYNYKNKVFDNPKNSILDFSGTHLFTKVVKEQLLENNFLKIQQLGIDFNGYGEYAMKETFYRYFIKPDYSLDRNSSIIE